MEYGVVIPAWNAERTIADTLNSVLQQTLPPSEIIVVDDGSDDETVSVAKSVSGLIQVITQDNHGPGRASSNGIRRLSAPLVALVDADDLWLPNKMARQIEVFEKNPQVDLVYCQMRQFRHGSDNLNTGEIRNGPNRSNSVLRRDVFLSVGGIIDPPGNRGDVIDWMARFRENGHREIEIKEVLALRRIISGSMSYGRDPTRDVGYLSVVHQAILRKRRQTEPEKS